MGINFFDTAEIYGMGEAETQMGQALKDLNVRRESVVISTKIWKCSPNGLNDQMMSRKHIVEGLQNSLKRLQLDYVDVVFSHRPDYECSLEETCAAMHYVIEKGLAFYWGTSEWTAPRIAAAIGICEKNGWHKPIVEQPQYNMIKRDKFESEFHYVFQDYKIGSTIWSPLCQGILTGKYNEGVAPSGSRFDKENSGNPFHRLFLQGEEKKAESLKMLNDLAALAKELGCTMA
jgi:aryl-alcohol dehydrogenase-like predicted oxidoreductase